MTDTIHIQIDHIDGALQRLIGLVERRGFHIDGIDMAPASGGEAARRISLTVRGRDAGRSIENLHMQIDRLFGTRRIADEADFRRQAA